MKDGFLSDIKKIYAEEKDSIRRDAEEIKKQINSKIDLSKDEIYRDTSR